MSNGRLMSIGGLLNIHRLFQDTFNFTARFFLGCVAHFDLVLTPTFLSLPTQPTFHKDSYSTTSCMPQKLLSQPRTWGTRFDSFILSDASPPRSPQKLRTSQTLLQSVFPMRPLCQRTNGCPTMRASLSEGSLLSHICAHSLH